MNSVNPYLGRQYDAEKYNCLHLSVEVWRELTGQDIGEHLNGLLQGAWAARRLGRHHASRFRALPAPLDPCLVLFQGPHPQPHVGVWLRGRVLHIRERAGVQFVPLPTASVGFTKVRFILPC